MNNSLILQLPVRWLIRCRIPDTYETLKRVVLPDKIIGNPACIANMNDAAVITNTDLDDGLLLITAHPHPSEADWSNSSR